MTEREYETWFDENLKGIESLRSKNDHSPFLNIPRPFHRKSWLIVNITLLSICLIGSYILGYLENAYPNWNLLWFSNALLNLSIGLAASLVILTFSNHRERNIAFYSDVIPLLKQRYDKLKTAHSEYMLKIDRARHAKDYVDCFNAWHIQSNTAMVIIGFFEYLRKSFPYTPKCFKGVDFDLELEREKILNLNNTVFSEYNDLKIISDETINECINSLFINDKLLILIEELIEELESELFVIKYGSSILAKKNTSV